MKRKAYGFIHCHTDHSLRDGAMSVQQLCSQAVEMNAKAITLTDHGTCTGWIEFMKTCKKLNINGIPGVEAYVKTEYEPRAHLVLLAKDEIGYRAICRAVTKSNMNQRTVAKVNTSVMTKDLLTECFSGGHVIALSACINGVIGSIFLLNEISQKKIAKLEKEIEKYASPNDSISVENKKRLESLTEEIEKLVQEKESLQYLANKKYTKRQKGVESLKISAPEIYEQEKRKFLSEIEASEQAKIELENIKAELKAKRSSKTALNKKIKKSEEEYEKYRKLLNKIEELKKKNGSQEDSYNAALQEAQWYRNLFRENFFIELQYHGLPQEQYIMPLLVRLSKELNIPVVATNDAHFAKRDDYMTRQYLKALRFKKWEEAESSDRQMYLKSDEELYHALLQIVDADTASNAIKNIQYICDSCHVQLPEEQHYPKYQEAGNLVLDAKKLLWEKAIQGIAIRYPNGGFDEARKERLKYEYQVICDMGYADYLLIVADFVNYAKCRSKEIESTGLGYGAGPGRGSGVGSLINYLLGITALDPLDYGLLFERFLNKDRVSMPDIDVDFSKEVRPDAISYVRNKYGSDSVAAIRTTNKQGAKDSIHNAARILGWKLFPGKDSDPNIATQRKKMYRLGNEIAADIPVALDIRISDCETVFQKFQRNKDAEMIIQIAKCLEGKIVSLSVHAAGVIIGDGKPLSDYIPLLYNRDVEQWAVQCDMIESEEIGLLKMDFLGLKTLDILTETIREIKKTYSVSIDLEKLPMEKEIFQEIFSKGNTNCVFQLESEGMKQMLREFRPECFEDLILLLAAYRPGPMEFIPEIISVKHGRAKASYLIPELEPILKSTYGKPIYQEQLMDIFHVCAGFSLGEADIIRRYMSKKKIDKFLAYRPRFISGLQEHGVEQKEAETFWESLVDFAKYAFNKSHAATYAVIAYQTAWLKYHYPEQFLCAVLNQNEVKKIPFIIQECRNMELQVLGPDINLSAPRFTIPEKGSIRYGLRAISGINQQADIIYKERISNGFYQNFCDYLFRVHPNKSDTEKLIKAGAFDQCDHAGRLQKLNTLSDRIKNLDTCYKKQNIVNRILKEMESPMDCKTKEQNKKRLETARELLERAKTKVLQPENNIQMLENKRENLKNEYEVLGCYISGHPLEAYTGLYQNHEINQLNQCQINKYANYIGLIEDVRLVERRSDGKAMAFFTFCDKTASIQVNCFAREYEAYASFIQSGQVVKIYGKITEETKYNQNNEKELKLTIKKIEHCSPDMPPFFISVVNMEWYLKYVKDKLSYFIKEDGYPAYLHDSATGSIYRLKERFSIDLLQIEVKNCFIKEFYSDKDNL